MKRHRLQQLCAWKTQPNRKPLILKGVRQTGKTYLLEQFGRENFAHYYIINCEKQKNICTLFEQDLTPSRVIDDLRLLLKAPINIHEDLLIIDEIQACPRALTSLKYFNEELPELAVCAAGSLLGLHLNESSYPVGKVDTLTLHPMTFTEFLSGINDEQAADYLFHCHLKSKISDPIHQQLWERLKQYFVTGGLPEIVSLFATHQNNHYQASQIVRKKQNELIEAYYADIAKHSGKVNAMHIARTWQSIPLQLSSTEDGSANRFKVKGVIPSINRYSQLVNVIDWLEHAELIVKIPIVEAVKQPLLAYSQDNSFKLLMFDIGILGAMSGLDPATLFDYDFGSYKGYFVENFVATQLLATDLTTIFNWQENRSEIEFLLPLDNQIIPIEVKSGWKVRTKSLQKYIKKYQPKTSYILSANNLTVDQEQQIIRLPLYLAERLVDLSHQQDRMNQ